MKRIYIVGISVLLIMLISIAVIITQGVLKRRAENKPEQPIAQETPKEEQEEKKPQVSPKTSTKPMVSRATNRATKSIVSGKTSISFQRRRIVATNPKSVRIELPEGAVYQKSCNSERCIIYIWE